LPAERAPTVSLPNLIARAATDTAGTLTNRLITVVGFTFKDAGATDLARIAITCCAADAQLARIHLTGGPANEAAALPDGTWLKAEGVVGSGAPPSTGSWIPALNVSALTRIDAPANPYAYNNS
jgi:putative membrane protein